MILENKVAIVTGASRGMGQAIAVSLAEEGIKLALVATSLANLKATQALCPVDTLPLAADLTDRDQCHQVVQFAVSHFGGVDFLINNAGVLNRDRADEADLEVWDHALDLNLRSAIHLTRHCLPSMKERGSGAIINIASMSGRISRPLGGIYCGTKFGMLGWAGSVFEDVRDHLIKVCTICPGFVNTEMVAALGHDPSLMIQPNDVARTVSYVLNMPTTACPVEIAIRPQRTVTGTSS